MSNPYEPPKSGHGEQPQQFVKIIGITLKKRTYLIVQAIIIGFLLITGSIFSFAMTSDLFGIKLNYIGYGFLLVAVLEVFEIAYALKYKCFTK